MNHLNYFNNLDPKYHDVYLTIFTGQLDLVKAMKQGVDQYFTVVIQDIEEKIKKLKENKNASDKI